MFYTADQLPRGLFKACVVPRPIAWVSTVSEDGVKNLAPFSYFNAVSDDPPMVVLAFSGGHREGGAKDTLTNIEKNGDFVINLVNHDMRHQMNVTAAPVSRSTSEFDLAQVESLEAKIVKAARVRQSPVHLECRLYKTVDLPSMASDSKSTLVIAHVLGIHVCPSVMSEGRLDIRKLKPIARLGYHDYALINDTFELMRP